MRSAEIAECGKWGVWKMRSAENEECGKCGVWKMRSAENVSSDNVGMHPVFRYCSLKLPKILFDFAMKMLLIFY